MEKFRIIFNKRAFLAERVFWLTVIVLGVAFTGLHFSSRSWILYLWYHFWCKMNNANNSQQHNKMLHKILQLSNHFEEWIWGPGSMGHESSVETTVFEVRLSRWKPTNDPLQDNSPTKGFPKLTICLNSQHSGIIHKDNENQYIGRPIFQWIFKSP